MDDDEDVLGVTAALLRAGGFEVELTRDGQEAVDTYRRAMDRGSRYGAILMDLTVRGGMGGREAMELILRLDPDARGIVASGYSNDPILADHTAHGFRGRITKPYLRDDLRAVLLDVMGLDPSTL